MRFYYKQIQLKIFEKILIIVYNKFRNKTLAEQKSTNTIANQSFFTTHEDVLELFKIDETNRDEKFEISNLWEDIGLQHYKIFPNYFCF